ncbi:phage N-6-adenine-methyltransferase [Acidithiobacillus ferrooxidans]|uniref:phage N-6-adenine-methyltransferase n=1 Tax=Acidithiobacillus ferrooxidans TaxID=920 RepID=UPI00214BE4BB|nr:phage N-6-adenine-methyltransferase [Acidithiobacillus ferrooxidans]MCR2831460.1 phage N-6-adenine-methyltransferase [Acidithiobacillus ferrooxidans]
MGKKITLSITPEVGGYVRRRALSGVGSMKNVVATGPSPASLVNVLGGVRPAARATGMGTDTVYALCRGEGSISSYRKLAAAAGLSVEVVRGKSRAWQTLHSSLDMTWRTPPEVWRMVLVRLDIHQFTLDPCSPGPDSAIPCADHYTPAEDGLSRSWGEPGGAGAVWVNPPYGRALGSWIDKMIAEAYRGVKMIALVPARTGTKWWHKAIDAGAEAEFLRGRLRFLDGDGNPRDAAPFDSALLWWNAGAGLVHTLDARPAGLVG